MSFADDYINDQLKLAAIAGDLNRASLLRELLNARNRAELAEAALERARALVAKMADARTFAELWQIANDLADALGER